MNKIIVLGNSGAGKSFFTALLAKKMNIDYLHLDKIVYKYSWDNPRFDDMKEEVDKLILKERWIMDGNFLNNCKNTYCLVFLSDINSFLF